MVSKMAVLTEYPMAWLIMAGALVLGGIGPVASIVVVLAALGVFATSVLVAIILLWGYIKLTTVEQSSIQVERPAFGNSPSDQLAMMFIDACKARSQHAPLVHGGMVPREQKIDELINQCMEFFIEDCIEIWYRPICGDDPELRIHVKRVLWTLADALHIRLQEIDWLTLLTRDLVIIWTNHLVNLRQSSTERFPSHPCLASEEAELQYAREMTETLLRCLLPSKQTDSDMARCLVRELFAGQAIVSTIETIADPTFINQYIISKCDEVTKARQQKGTAFQNSADILKTIKNCKEISVVTDLRYQIITEMMQIRHIEDMKRSATRAEDKVALERMLELDAKAKELKNRNLGRYMHQLQFAKRESERQIVKLGGRDYRSDTITSQKFPVTTSSPGSPELGSQNRTRKGRSSITTMLKKIVTLEEDQRLRENANILTLPEIISNGIAIAHFKEYLRKNRAVKNLKFWITTQTLLQAAENSESVPCELLRQVFHVIQSHSSDKSVLQIRKETLDLITATVNEECNKHHDVHAVENGFCSIPIARACLIPFVHAQIDVYDYLYRQHYRKFVFSDQYMEYIKKLGESDHANLYLQEERDEICDERLGTGVNAKWAQLRGSKESSPVPESETSVMSPMEVQSSTQPSVPASDEFGYIIRSQERIRSTLKKKQMTRELFPEQLAGTSKIGKLDEEISALSSKLRHLEHSEEMVDEWTAAVGQWDVKVLSVQEMEDTDLKRPSEAKAQGSKQTTSTVILLQVYKNGSEDKGRIVTRTIDDFNTIHEHMRDCSASVPERPPWRSKGWSLLRQEKLTSDALLTIFQKYLSDILSDQKLCGSEDLFKFFNPESADVERYANENTEEGDEAAEEDMDSLAEPVYGLVNELFVLKGIFKWFRRQLIFFVKLTYGGSVNSNVQQSLDWLFSPEQLVYYLESFRDTMFPPADTESFPELNEEEIEAKAAEAKEKFLSNLPEVLPKLIGQKNANLGAVKLFDSLQNKHVNKHLLFVLLEKLVEKLLPNVEQREHLPDDLIEMDATIHAPPVFVRAM